MVLIPALIIGFAFFVESTLGFGGGLVAIPLLGFIFPMSKAVALAAVFQLLMGFLTVKTYRDVAWERWKRFLPGMIVGVLAGSVSIQYFNDDFVRVFLALLIIAYLARSRLRKTYGLITIKNTDALSFCGGWIMGLIGAGGPLYVVYFREHTSGLKAFRASLIMAFLVTNCLRIPGYLSTGAMDADVLKTAAFALPGFLLALWGGQVLHDRIPVGAFHAFVDILLLVSSLSLITKALF